MLFDSDWLASLQIQVVGANCYTINVLHIFQPMECALLHKAQACLHKHTHRHTSSSFSRNTLPLSGTYSMLPKHFCLHVFAYLHAHLFRTTACTALLSWFPSEQTSSLSFPAGMPLPQSDLECTLRPAKALSGPKLVYTGYAPESEKSFILEISLKKEPGEVGPPS